MIRTLSGIAFDIDNLTDASIQLRDITAGLSKECRFNGQIPQFYSVAEHSVLMARNVSQEFRLWCLLHDASEAYIKDLPSPWKKRYPQYQKDENTILEVVARKFRLRWPMPNEIHLYDNAMLQAEYAQIRFSDPWRVGLPGVLPMKVKLEFWTPEQAEQRFLSEYYQCMMY